MWSSWLGMLAECFHLHQLIARHKTKKGHDFLLSWQKQVSFYNANFPKIHQIHMFKSTEALCSPVQQDASVLHLFHHFTNMCVFSRGEVFVAIQELAWFISTSNKDGRISSLRLRYLTSIQWKNNGKSPLPPPPPRGGDKVTHRHQIYLNLSHSEAQP